MVESPSSPASPPPGPGRATGDAENGDAVPLLATDRLFVIFGALLALAWIGPALTAPWAWSYVLRNLGVVALYLVLTRIRLPSLGAAVWLRVALVSVVIPFNYFQTGALIEALQPSYVPQIEAFLLQSDLTLFGPGFHDWLHEIQRPVAVELLQLCYASFFFLPVVLLLILSARGKLKDVPEAFLGVVFALLVSYVGYLLVPARSPGFLHPELAPGDGVWIARELWVYLRELGDGAHDAFPSGHTAVSLLLIYYAARFDWIALVLVGPVAAALVLSTVYLQYHYVVDVLAGLLLTVLAAWFARRIASRGRAVGHTTVTPEV